MMAYITNFGQVSLLKVWIDKMQDFMHRLLNWPVNTVNDIVSMPIKRGLVWWNFNIILTKALRLLVIGCQVLF